MGNSSSKDHRHASGSSHPRHADRQPSSSQQPQPSGAGQVYTSSNRGARGSRPDLSFLGSLGGRDRDGGTAAPDRPRETKQEREARRAERERQARLKERERSMREEHVDGGYLVTLGTYVGPEDYNKAIVRQLQIERRLAPFWKGLDDHSDAWTEWQLVAAAKGLPIPAADEIPPEMVRAGSQASADQRALDGNANNLAVPIASRSQSYQSDISLNLSTSHPTPSSFAPSSLPNSGSSSSQLFRGRAKTLASLASGRGTQSPDLIPQELRLPNDPNVNGQPLEAYLYKDAAECPICFLYYPPYLNHTRCCDQSICSECFVQIKRPDPHPPEHEQPGQSRPAEEEAESLVSEIAVCPFCVTPDFGVTYEPPPFRRGLAYAGLHSNPLKSQTSATSSTTSLTPTTPGRRRATSLSANAPNVITIDRIRPDWAKKLADARAHALRRSAAATALHNAAYVLGNQGEAAYGRGVFGRRRRTLLAASPGGSGSGTPREGAITVDFDTLMHFANAAGGQGDDRAARDRQHRMEDIEDLMLAEAIRLSLAAEDERRRKEEKEEQKEAKKKAKAAAKEEKKAAKLAKRNGSLGSLYPAGTNESSHSVLGSSSMTRSSSNLVSGAQPVIQEEMSSGKGKQPVQGSPSWNADASAGNPFAAGRARSSSSQSPSPELRNAIHEDPQRHLAESRANLQPCPSAPIPLPGTRIPHLRQLSNASSTASSFVDSSPGSLYHGESGLHSTADFSVNATDTGTPHRSSTPPVESMFNFRSLAAMVDDGHEDKRGSGSGSGGEHRDEAQASSNVEEEVKEPSPRGSPLLHPTLAVSVDGIRRRGNSGESSGSDVQSSSPSASDPADGETVASHATHDGDSAAPMADREPSVTVVRHADQKDLGTVNVLNREAATQ